MKRIIAIILASVMLICFAACEPAAESKSYVFVSKGVRVAVGDDAKATAAALGEAQNIIETPTCGGGEEPDREYVYAGFKFYSVNENGVNKIVKIVFTDDSVSTPEGILVGSSREDVIAAYGENFTETAGGISYTEGNTRLMFGIKNGMVSAIQYTEA